jgi:glycine oxidase
MLSLQAAGETLKHVVRDDRAYMVPRPDGRIVTGSTIENAGYEKCVTPAGMMSILGPCIEMAPSLAEAQIVETWSGLRPGTPDDLPIIGPTDKAGLLIATGHYRNGILLAPITAKLVSAFLSGEHLPLDWSRYSPMRFAEPRATMEVKS